MGGRGRDPSLRYAQDGSLLEFQQASDPFREERGRQGCDETSYRSQRPSAYPLDLRKTGPKMRVFNGLISSRRQEEDGVEQ